MKAQIFLLLVALVTPVKEYAQTKLNKTIPVQSGQNISMRFDYPELVRISTWDRNEIVVTGDVSINNGENDDAFLFENSVSGNTVMLNASIRDIKHLPQRITIERDGQKIVFKDKSELKKYQQEHGTAYNNMSWGADIDIQLEIKVPRNMETRIEAVYGLVEVKNFAGPLTVESTYGGVDVALAEKAAGEITAETNYGEIFTNLDAKFSGDKMRNKDFHTYVTAKPGSGPKYALESKYGNVYIRKAAN
jgi:hypothetical protein